MLYILFGNVSRNTRSTQCRFGTQVPTVVDILQKDLQVRTISELYLAHEQRFECSSLFLSNEYSLDLETWSKRSKIIRVVIARV